MLPLRFFAFLRKKENKNTTIYSVSRSLAEPSRKPGTHGVVSRKERLWVLTWMAARTLNRWRPQLLSCRDQWRPPQLYPTWLGSLSCIDWHLIWSPFFPRRRFAPLPFGFNTPAFCWSRKMTTWALRSDVEHPKGVEVEGGCHRREVEIKAAPLLSMLSPFFLFGYGIERIYGTKYVILFPFIFVRDEKTHATVRCRMNGRSHGSSHSHQEGRRQATSSGGQKGWKPNRTRLARWQIGKTPRDTDRGRALLT
jgi:hypothetical protein